MKKIRLRCNTFSISPNLDRIQQFDERSKLFTIAPIDASRPLRSYTWRCNQWFNQGNEGACVAFSLGHELAARPSEVQGITPKFLKEEIYWNAQRNDPWNGGAYPGAYPFYEGTSVLAGVKEVVRRGYASEYRWAFNTPDALCGVGHNGPAVIGINWYEGMMYPDASGFIHPTGQCVGGHAILMRAVNMPGQYVTLRNSWGKDWGVQGDCYLKFADLAKLLRENGECVFLMHRKTKP